MYRNIETGTSYYPSKDDPMNRDSISVLTSTLMEVSKMFCRKRKLASTQNIDILTNINSNLLNTVSKRKQTTMEEKDHFIFLKHV